MRLGLRVLGLGIWRFWVEGLEIAGVVQGVGLRLEVAKDLVVVPAVQ